MAKKKFFVAGTDTDVGKTLISSALLHCARAKGLETLGLKPVAAGCEMTDQGLRNADALNLISESSVSLPYEQVNPVALAPAIAPHIAAVQAQKRVSADRLVGLVRGAFMQPFDFCVVEGAGGWRVPLNARETMADLAKQLDLPVVLVVGVRLGCLNHALLTAEAIIRDGLKISGWVANVIDADMPVLEENIGTLRHVLPFPDLGVVPFQKGITAPDASKHLDISKLLETHNC